LARRLGATAGYLGGRVDEWMIRFVDILYALPYMFFVIVLTVVFGRVLAHARSRRSGG
jgi:oligopeptide transport system permease protein